MPAGKQTSCSLSQSHCEPKLALKPSLSKGWSPTQAAAVLFGTESVREEPVVLPSPFPGFQCSPGADAVTASFSRNPFNKPSQGAKCVQREVNCTSLPLPGWLISRNELDVGRVKSCSWTHRSLDGSNEGGSCRAKEWSCPRGWHDRHHQMHSEPLSYSGQGWGRALAGTATGTAPTGVTAGSETCWELLWGSSIF